MVRLGVQRMIRLSSTTQAVVMFSRSLRVNNQQCDNNLHTSLVMLWWSIFSDRSYKSAYRSELADGGPQKNTVQTCLYILYCKIDVAWPLKNAKTLHCR